MTIASLSSSLRIGIQNLAGPKNSQIPKTLLAARLAISEAAKAFADSGKEIGPQFSPIFINPQLEAIENRIYERIEKEGSGTTHFYHGTGHVDSILEQALSNDEGLLEHRVCHHGDAHLGLYGTGCPIQTACYSGAEFIIRVASESDVQFDPLRGTPALRPFDKKYVMEILHVTNRIELMTQTRPSLLARAIRATNAAKEAIKLQ